MVVTTAVCNGISVTIHNDYCKEDVEKTLPIIIKQISDIISDSYLRTTSNENKSNINGPLT